MPDQTLRPSTIVELEDCLSDLQLHPADRRIERLVQVYRDLTGEELPATGSRQPEGPVQPDAPS